MESNATVQTRTITWLYILALSMVAILTLTGQVLVQWSLASLQGDSTTVNIAGRQRMLSQRIPKIILALDDYRTLKSSSQDLRTEEDPFEQRSIDELRAGIATWRANHHGLANASREVGLFRENSPTVDQLFKKIAPDFYQVEMIAQSALERLQNRTSMVMHQQQRMQLLTHSDSFLASMDAIVAQYEFEARQRVIRLQYIERGLLLATLVVLVCEGLFIFSPAIASLNKAFERLKSVTKQLEIAKENAEQADRAKTQFLARVSHELRTPLHAILGMLGLIRKGRLSSIQRKRADLAYTASRTLRHLVDDLLDVSSVESGAALSLQLVATDAKKLIDDCVQLMKPQAKRKGLSLYATQDLSGDACLVLDEFRLRQILINLLQNAIRYTKQGHIECHAWIEHSTATEAAERIWLNVAVHDTGCGIAPEHHERIFENFVRLHPAESSRPIIGPRMGLGLPITASLVATMGGTISVKSNPGAGSTFSIRIPTSKAPPASLDPPIASEKQGTEPFNKFSLDFHASPAIQDQIASPLEVTPQSLALIVDDSKVNRLLMRGYLRRLGIKSVGTNRIKRAWKLFIERRPALVLLDLHIGDKQTMELASAMCGYAQDNPPLLFMVTADVHFTLEGMPNPPSIAGVLRKPIEFEELQTALNPWVSVLCSSHAGITEPSAAAFEPLRNELRRILTEQLPADFRQLHHAFAKGDLQTIRLIAHRWRGSAGNAGWHELASAATALELHPESFGEFATHPQWTQWGVAR